MKRTTVLLLLMFLLFAIAGGAEEMPEVPFESGMGLMAGLLSLDLSRLNEILNDAGHPELPGRLVVFGTSSRIDMFDIPMSIGSIVLHGTVASRAGERKSSLTLDLWGGTGEYIHRFENGSVFGIGTALVMGSATLQVRDRAAADFLDLIARPTISRASFFFWGGIPYLRVQVYPLEWLRLEGIFGYLLAISGRWTENGQVVDGPRPSLNAPFIAVRVSINWLLPEEPPTAVEPPPD